MSAAWWLNTAWMMSSAGEFRRFHQATSCVEETQREVLLDTIRRNADTDFGRDYGFRDMNSVESFQSRVPLSTWEDYRRRIERIGNGERNVLTADDVQVFEPTSGSTSGEKLIPCTQSLRRQFQRAIAAWLADLFRQRPAVRAGRAYWSVSPAGLAQRQTAGGIPIGFDDDTEWLGPVERVALKRLLAVPTSVTRFSDITNFRYCTLLCLVRAADLSLISVWSPTFLISLLQPLPQWIDRIGEDLRAKQITLPGDKEPIPSELLSRSRSDRRRADELAGIVKSCDSRAELFCRIWPRLALISCWTDASAAAFLPQLQSMFPSVEIQPKGLLATEGCVSFPLVDHDGAALALRSHFFEFESADSGSAAGVSGELQLAHQLELNKAYNVVLTTGGGLYRYQLRDSVQVVGFENQCPLLKFQGRSDSSSDLVGEKLSEPHVRSVLTRAFEGQQIDATFALVVPVSGTVSHYRLYLETGSPVDANRLQARVEDGLRQNPYYRHAIEMRQLSELEIFRIPEHVSGWAVYERGCLRRGQKAGNIKPAMLDPRPGWPDEFAES